METAGDWSRRTRRVMQHACRRAARWRLVAAVGCCVLAGCGKADSLTTVPVSGRVLLDDKPVSGWYICFFPDNSRGTSGPAAMAPLGPDGTFQLRSAGSRPGAVTGHHRVFLEPIPGDSPEEPLGPAGKSAVPFRYQKPETSGLVAEVVGDRKNDIEIRLESNAK